jgi:chemotaxis protein CheX
MTATVSLPERMDLASAAPLSDTLRAQIGADLTLDASGVRHVGALGAQVLLSAVATWAATGHALALDRPSADFLTQMAELGLDPDDLTADGVAHVA